MTLANDAATAAPKPSRVAKEQAEIALKAAAGGRWQESAEANRAILALGADIRVEEQIGRAHV